MTTQANAGSIGNQKLNVTIIAGQDQTAIVGQPFNAQFTVRLTDDKGLPYSNVDVSFQNDICFSFPHINTCPPPSAWGNFINGERSVLVTTNSLGIAVAPIYVAGTTPSDGSPLLIYVPANRPPFNFTFPQSRDALKLIRFTQIPVPPRSIPTLSLENLIALMMAITFAGIYSHIRTNS